MSGLQTAYSQESMREQKKSVAGNSVIAALVITFLKVAVGVTTGSLGILSEAAHSGLDLVAAVVTFLSVRVSDRPADADHQYGHEKVENISAFIQTGLLLIACVWIIYEAVGRIIFHRIDIQPTPAAFVVMLISMAVDIWRSRSLRRIAVRYESQALEADALHFSTDVWSSGVVIVGLLFVWIGHVRHTPWLYYSDPVAALFVAGVVIYVSGRLGRRTLDALLDAAPPGVRSRIVTAVSKVDGLLDVDRVRIRRAGNRYFADLSVGLSRNVTFQRAEQVVGSVTAAVKSVLPNADVIVRSVPRADHQENIFDRVRAVATRNNFNVHDVSIQTIDGRLHVEQHLELDERLSLKQAHDQVTQLEAQILSDVPEISSIITHIESEPSTIERSDRIVKDARLERTLCKVAQDFNDILDVHDMKVKQVGGKLYVSCHCTFPDDMELSQVHALTTELEIRFKQEEPKLFRVLIHPEPQTDNRR